MTEERGYKKKASEDVSPLSDKSLLDEPKLISTINTGYGLTSVACRRDEEIWTCERDEIIKLYNLHGELLSLIETKSKNEPGNIAVAENGILIYTDPVRRTVNVVRDRQTQERIRLQEWKPYYVCITSSEDLLVTMLRDDAGNLDICVADNKARAVVVVNQAGELRFRYNGHPSSTTKSIDPVGITTDSQGLILVADSENNCIHILDQDGGFLFYIDKCNLHLPYGLCVDTKDNLFVAELIS
ncbi:uncharacterized protein LOC134244771, partial [Saccostrea cucullata]|uniref:uncharacterized protein LOC134244771 n=1 Tax=Saccostrea cuccullata TaxID=36930 RepID=UPI002ED1C4A3